MVIFPRELIASVYFMLNVCYGEMPSDFESVYTLRKLGFHCIATEVKKAQSSCVAVEATCKTESNRWRAQNILR